MSTKPKSSNSSLTQLLNAMGLSEQEVRREVSDEVLTTKMSLVGTLEGIKFVIESLKNMILTTPGKLNTQLIRLYLTAIRSSSVFAMNILDKYEDMSGSNAPIPLTKQSKNAKTSSKKNKNSSHPITYELTEDDLDDIEASLDATESDLEALDKQLREEAELTLSPEEIAELEQLEKDEANLNEGDDGDDDIETIDDLLDLKGFVPVKKITDPKKQN